MSEQSQAKPEAADVKQKEVPVHSNTPENSEGKVNPSAPEGPNTTPSPVKDQAKDIA